MISEIEDGKSGPIPQEKYDLLLWTQHEKLYRDRAAFRNKVLAEISVPFTIALQVKLRRSVFGTYLKYFNENQWQNEFLNHNKLAITESILREFDARKQDMFDYNNNLFDDVMRYLKNTATETDEIDCRYLYQNATHLRLDDYHINTIDDGVRNFQNLQVLVICGNWISDIEGAFLPRRLKSLELYANEMRSLTNLTRKAPKYLTHLGLGRNKLTNDSCLYLLAKTGRFKNLRSLDISECDIYSLVDVLIELETLQNLEGLLLQGNPCSMVMGYKDLVLNSFPYLIFLDGTEISKTDRVLNENFLKGANNAELFCHCIKLAGLPKPPKGEKKTKQTIHVEFTMPLFQQDTKDEVDAAELEEAVVPETSRNGKGKDKKKKDKPQKDKKDKKGAKPSPYSKENEYNPRVKNNSFETQRKAWGKNIFYSPIVLKSPENNLEAYRDSFRSSVNVRVIYLKILPPEKKKKGKKDKKSKKGGKKGTQSNKKSDEGKGKKEKGKSDKSSKSDKEKVNKQEQKKQQEPKETILKRITLINFYCDLFSINWNDPCIDFYWSESPEFGNKAVEYKSYLEELRRKAEEENKAKLEKKGKSDKGSKKGDKKSKTSKDKKSKKSNKSLKSAKSKKSKVSKKSKPKGDSYMSCTVSFGLSRIGSEIKEARSDKPKKGKKGKKGKKSNA